MQKYKRTTTRNKFTGRKWIWLLVLVLVIGGLIYFVVSKNNDDNSSNTTNGDTSEGVDLNPATENDKKENDQHKQDIVAKEEVEKNANNNPKTTSVIITSVKQNSSGEVEVRGYANSFNENGTCTLTMTMNSATATSTGPATQNVSTMSCGTLKISRSKLSPGIWSATLTYQSGDTKGQKSTNITVK